MPVWQRSAALTLGFALTACFYEVPDLLTRDGSPPSCEDADLATSSDHCGACNRSCLGGSCSEGQCDPGVVANGQEGPSGLVVDATHVYWTSQGGGWVAKADKLDLGVVVIAEAQTGAYDIVQDDAFVYWTNHGAGQVMKFAKQDGSPSLVAEDVGALAIAVDEQAIYWTTRISNATSFDGAVKRMAKEGGEIVTLATDAGNLTVATVAAGYVYWSNLGANKIKRVATGGGSVEEVADAPGGPRGLTFFEGVLYWVENSGAIQKWEAGAAMQLADAPYDLRDVAVDASGIFATSLDGLEVVRLAHGGSAIETLATTQKNPHDIALDASAVYWTNYGGTTIVRLAR